MKKPGFWRVLIAYGIDICLLFIMDAIWGIGIINLCSFPDGLWLLAFILSFAVLNVGYFMVLEGRNGFSVGKGIVNLWAHSTKKDFFTWRICGAYSLDSILFLIFLIFCFGIGSTAAPYATDFFTSLQAEDGSGQLVIVLFNVVIGVPFLVLIYYAFLETLFGASLGKKLMGLQVVQKETK